MIQSIALQNWKSHSSTSLQFDSGTNLLLGRMGSGKTSIFDAVCFALFGTFPALKQKRIKVSELIQNWPEKKDSAEVAMVFFVDGKKYEIKRTILRKGAAEATLRDENGKIMEFGPTQVTARIESILKTDYDLFFRAIYSVQNGIDHFLTLPKGERKRDIDETLGLDKFEVARRNIGKIANLFLDEKNQKNIILKQFDVLETKNEYELANQRLSKLLTEKKSEESGLEMHSRQINEKKAILQQKMELKSRHDLMRQEIDRTDGALSRLKRNLFDKKTGIADLNLESFNLLSINVKSRKENLKNLEIFKSSLTSSLKVMAEESGRLSSEISEIESFLNGKKEFLNAKSLENEKMKLIDAQEEIKQKFNLNNKNINSLTGIFSKLLSEVQRLDIIDKKIESLNLKMDKLPSYEKLILSITNIENEISQKTAILVGLEEKSSNINVLVSEMHACGGKCPLCESHLTHDKLEEILKIKNDEMLDIKRKIINVNSDLKSLKEAHVAQLDAKAKIDEINADLVRLKEDAKPLVGVRERLVEVQARLADLNTHALVMQSIAEKNEKRLYEISESILNSKIYGLKRDSLDGLKSRQANINLRVSDSEKKLFDVEAQLKSIDVFKLEQDEAKVKLFNESLELEKQIGELERKKEALEFEISRISIKNEDISKCQAQVNELLVQEGDAKSRLSSINTEITSLNLRIAQLARLIKNSEDISHEIEKLDKKIEFSQKLQNAIVATQSSLRAHLVQAINLAMQQLWPIIYAYKNYNLVRLDARDDDYALQLNMNGEWIDVDGFASGGERSSACLALRIAFAMALAPNLGWLILDEPTHNLDADGVNALAIALKEKIPQIVDQVFVVTHDEMLKEANGKIHYFEKDENGISQALQNGGFE